MEKTQTQIKDWICFVNELGKSQQAFINLVEVDDFWVKFKTREGTLTIIPSRRVLKIKREVSG